jgi:dihydrofolate reductase
MGVQVCAFLATSLDGFIAREDGNIDWLEEANARVPDGEDCGFGKFFASVDTLVLGRKSFEKVLSFPQWPYGEKPVYVMSKKGIKIPEHLARTVSSTDQSPQRLISSLEALGMKRIYIDGGQIVRAFLSAGLLDELTITRIPVLIHNGISLFGTSPYDTEVMSRDLWMELAECQSWPFGFVQDVWRAKKNQIQI